MKKCFLWEVTSNCPEETEEAGARLAKQLRGGDFVALYGDLGAGKTALVRGIASVLAPMAKVSSPTYTIVHEYPAPFPFRHLDLYRIENEEDLYSIGFFDFPEEGIVVAEWCEKIPYALPANRLEVYMEHCGENQRKIRVFQVRALPDSPKNDETGRDERTDVK